MDARLAAASDEAELFEIHRAVFQGHVEQIWGWDEGWQRANFAREMASSTTLVVRIDASLAGDLQFREEDDRLFVHNVALLPDCQNRGIGTELIRVLQAKAANRGIPLELAVFRTNASALRFYERLGFEKRCATDTHTAMFWRPT
jgi:ribosomal protein S18 acetylase RimI-like enzyme